MNEAYVDVLMAKQQASRAIRRGDLAAAERWMRIARQAIVVAQVMSPFLRAAAAARRARAS